MLTRTVHAGSLVRVVGGVLVVAGVLSVVLGRSRRLTDRQTAVLRRHLTARQPQVVRSRLLGMARAIVGTNKSTVMSVLGPPRIAMFVGQTTPDADYQSANVWYYPLKRSDRMGMAIRFDDERAASVEFFPAKRF